jgi:hypothetical protein
MANNDNFPPRDKYVLVEALSFSVEALSVLPIEHRPDNNIADMKRLLDTFVSSDPALSAFQDIAHRRFESLKQVLTENR